MAAPLGNRFWEARSSHGRNPIFGSPDDLWKACTEYFEWAENNPLIEEKLFSYQGVISRDTVAKMRAMTISGLCTFLDIDQSTWENYRSREDFFRVVVRVENVIRDQKFAGAAAELLNPNIIARDLGLSEKQELTGKDGGPIEFSDTERAARIAAILERGRQERARQTTGG